MPSKRNGWRKYVAAGLMIGGVGFGAAVAVHGAINDTPDDFIQSVSTDDSPSVTYGTLEMPDDYFPEDDHPLKETVNLPIFVENTTSEEVEHNLYGTNPSTVVENGNEASNSAREEVPLYVTILKDFGVQVGATVAGGLILKYLPNRKVRVGRVVTVADPAHPDVLRSALKKEAEELEDL